MRQANHGSNGTERSSLLRRAMPLPAQIGVGVAAAAVVLFVVRLPYWPADATWRLMLLDLLVVAAVAAGTGLYAGLTAAAFVTLYYLGQFAIEPARSDLLWLPLLAATSIGIALLGGWPRRLLKDLEHELNGTRRLLQGANRRLESALETERLRAYYDQVTDLPSRRNVIDRFGQGLSQARRGNTLLALLLLDLDRFREVNDRIGHDAADQVLRQVGQRLLGVTRREDTVGRLDSDTFVVLLTGVTEPSGIATARQKITDALAAPFVLADPPGEIVISACLGTAVYPEDGNDWESLYWFAEEALNLAKRRPEQPAAGG